MDEPSMRLILWLEEMKQKNAKGSHVSNVLLISPAYIYTKINVLNHLLSQQEYFQFLICVKTNKLI